MAGKIIAAFENPGPQLKATAENGEIVIYAL